MCLRCSHLHRCTSANQVDNTFLQRRTSLAKFNQTSKFYDSGYLGQGQKMVHHNDVKVELKLPATETDHDA